MGIPHTIPPLFLPIILDEDSPETIAAKRELGAKAGTTRPEYATRADSDAAAEAERQAIMARREAYNDAHGELDALKTTAQMSALIFGGMSAIEGLLMAGSLGGAGAGVEVGTGSAIDAAIAEGVTNIGTAAGTNAGLTTGSALGSSLTSGAVSGIEAGLGGLAAGGAAVGSGALESGAAGAPTATTTPTSTAPSASPTGWLDTAWGAVKSPLGQAAIGAGSSIYSANKAADAAKDASSVAAGAQASQLAYLKEINALPQQYKEEALRKLAGAAGLPGGEGSQSSIIEQARQSPLYQSIMGGQKAGEEAILRTASATGHLRSGNSIDAIADDAEARENNALLLSFNQQMGGLQGFAGLPTNETNIGNVMADIGSTEAAGITAEAQAKQYGLQGITDSLLSAGGNYERNRSI